jgi:2-dehydropantoate 2-reductase
VDLILVCVKAWQVPEAATALQPMVGPDTFVVPLQNGIEAPDQLASVVGRSHVLGGLCGIVAYVAGPGHICHMAGAPMIKFGELNNRPSSRVAILQDIFKRAAGLEVEVPPDIRVAMWQKFLLIAAWSGVGAVTRAPIGEILSRSETLRMLENSISEILDVAQKKDIPLPKTAPKRVMDFLEALPPDSTTSMQRDIIDGRPSELENQTGTIVRLGRETNIATPVNLSIYQKLLPLENRARKKFES